MSLNPRDLTQGGQVAFMRLKMFLQINNLISYYVIMGTVLFGIAVLCPDDFTFYGKNGESACLYHPLLRT